MKAVKRCVSVDMGYGPAENWVTATVVDSQTVVELFGGG